jgi:hypothetical protein
MPLRTTQGMLMGQPQPGRKDRRPGVSQDAAVTPVIGAVLILGITVLGIAGVLLWGAPMIDRIQSQNAQTAIVGEFEDLRVASRELSVPDHSRFPTVVVPRGELAVERGSRIMVTATFESDCKFHVTGWTDADAVASVDDTDCSGVATTSYLVAGDTLVPTPFSGADQGTDWLWRHTGPLCPDSTGDVCAEAWLHSGDQVRWDLDSSDQERSVQLDSGAIFSEAGGTVFLEKEPVIADSVFGSAPGQPYYGLWLRSLDAPSYSSVSGTGSHQVYFSLIGNYLRTDDPVHRIRYDVSGDLSEAWCNALLARNDGLPDGVDAGTDPDSSYRSQVADCGALPSEPTVRSVCFMQVVATDDACATDPTPTSFTFRFLHARIYTSLSL